MQHKCKDCPFANWIHDNKVFCMYGPSCVKDQKGSEWILKLYEKKK